MLNPSTVAARQSNWQRPWLPTVPAHTFSSSSSSSFSTFIASCFTSPFTSSDFRLLDLMFFKRNGSIWRSDAMRIWRGMRGSPGTSRSGAPRGSTRQVPKASLIGNHKFRD